MCSILPFYLKGFVEKKLYGKLYERFQSSVFLGYRVIFTVIKTLEMRRSDHLNVKLFILIQNLRYYYNLDEAV